MLYECSHNGGRNRLTYNYVMPRNRAVAVVVHDNKLLTMFRRNEKEYYTFPGGGVEPGETNEQAVEREIYEEVSLRVEVDRLVYELHHDNGDIHYYFLCTYLSGEPKVQIGTNEYRDNLTGVNTHLPQWLPLDGMSRTGLYPLEVRDKLLRDVAQGFEDHVVKFNLQAV